MASKEEKVAAKAAKEAEKKAAVDAKAAEKAKKDSEKNAEAERKNKAAQDKKDAEARAKEAKTPAEQQENALNNKMEKLGSIKEQVVRNAKLAGERAKNPGLKLKGKKMNTYIFQVPEDLAIHPKITVTIEKNGSKVKSGVYCQKA